ncbi:stalk domain-containing protein [Clostridiisalibacter paucivorans]|uniref:stalk domain-containing protein n=1 Tax=Clostridiisalibacter paucivorans TaxID=408753 RepID=UPI00047A4C7F|nr:stalk domain-containing protein [Clostridiisalibacter paucivorans]
MTKFHIKSLILGLLIGTVGSSIFWGISRTSEVSYASPSEKIESAIFNSSKVYFYEEEISLENPLVAIKKNEDSEILLYAPMREMLEYMQFNVKWNNEDNSVHLTMNGYTNDNTISTTGNQNEVDMKALDIVQKTGNWKYIEEYLPHMSTDAIKKAVEIYNSKHINSSEHKDASDYIKN